MGRAITEPEVYEALHEIFADVFGRDVSLEASTSADDIEDWDSFAQLELVTAVESRFSILLDDRDAMRMTSVGDMVEAILERS